MEMGDIYSGSSPEKSTTGKQKSKSVCRPTNENPLRNRRRSSRIVSQALRRFSAREYRNTDLGRPSRDSFAGRESVAFTSALTYQDTRVSAFHRRQTIVDVMVDEIAVIEDSIYEGLNGGYIFHISWSMYMFLLSLIGGCIIYANDDISFVDAWFNATSATVNSGLSVVSPADHSKSSYIVLGLLMALGCGPVTLLPTLIYRCHVLSKYKLEMETAMRSDHVPEESKHVIKQHQLLYDGSALAVVVVFLYIALCIFSGSLLLLLFVPVREMEPELRQRDFSFFDNAMFSSVSAFTNAGMLMSTNSLVYIENNAIVIAIYTFLILAGNVLMPVLLRSLFVAIQKMCVYFATPKETAEVVFSSVCSDPSPSASSSSLSNLVENDPTPVEPSADSHTKYWARWSRACAFTLNNPRLITTQLFLHMENVYLLQFFVLSNILLFVLFMCICLTNEEFKDANGGNAHTAFMGLFQNINMRHSGFGVFSFRDFPQSMLLVYAVAMFLSPVPYIGVLHASGHQKVIENIDAEAPILIVMKKIVGEAWFVRFLILFLLAVFEDRHMFEKPENVNLWYIIFEFISAYSLVGVSVGVPGKAYSLSGSFTKLGKVTVIVMFLLGKNRALPELSDPVVSFQYPELEQALEASALANMCESPSSNKRGNPDNTFTAEAALVAINEDDEEEDS